jgi:hypothetical protein
MGENNIFTQNLPTKKSTLGRGQGDMNRIPHGEEKEDTCLCTFRIN